MMQMNTRFFRGVMTASMVTLLCAAQFPAQGAPTAAQADDLAILIESGHLSSPSKIIVTHQGETSFIETWAGKDVRLWRREGDAATWSLLRNWSVLDGAWTHAHGVYSSAYSDGTFELFDNQSYDQLFRVRIELALGSTPEVSRFDDTALFPLLVRLPIRNETGEREWATYLGRGKGDFQRVFPLGAGEPLAAVGEIGPSEFMVKDHKGRYRFVTIDAQGQVRPLASLSKHEGVTRLRYKRGFVALMVGAGTDSGERWHFYLRQDGAWQEANARMGLDPEAVDQVEWGQGALRVRIKGEQNQDTAELNSFWLVDDAGVARNLTDMVPGLPGHFRNLRLLADETVIGVAEMDDLDGDGEAGTWTWRMRKGSGDWVPLSEALPGAPHDVWAAAEFLEGRGLGVQEGRRFSETAQGNEPAKTSSKNGGAGASAPRWADSADYLWSWYLRDEASGEWRPLHEQAGIDPAMEIVEVRDRRDGLVEVIERSATIPTVSETVPYEAQRTHWFMVLDDQWTAVREIVGRLHPGLEDRVVAVDARNNALMIDVRTAGNGDARLLFYRDRAGEWRELERGFFPTQARTRQSVAGVFPRVAAIDTVAEGRLVILSEFDDADWDGQAGAYRLLENDGDRWRVLNPTTTLGEEALQLEFDADRGLLIRKGRSPEDRGFFALTPDQGWQDVRDLLPGAPKVVNSAFVFADGQGVAVQDYLDSDGDGVDNEWDFAMRTPGGWQPLGDVVPDAFDTVATVVSAGGRSAIGVQEEGDANGNGVAYEWRYYYRHDGRWQPIPLGQLKGGSEITDLRVSTDGMLLTAREAWDADGDGQAFELVSGVWSSARSRYVPLAEALPAMPGTPVAAETLWQGRGLAVQVSEDGAGGQGPTGTRQSAAERWHVYELNGEDQWVGVAGLGTVDVGELRGDASGRLLATRAVGDAAWRLFHRPAMGQAFGSLATGGAVSDIRFEPAQGGFAVKASDLVSGDRREWQHWVLDGDKPLVRGRSAEGMWFGFDHVAIGAQRLVFEGASHYVDGIRTESIARPRIWLHRNAESGSREGMLYAPQLLDSLFSADGETRYAGIIEAAGFGPEGTVLVYRTSQGLTVLGLTNGPVQLLGRPLLGTPETGAEHLMLVANGLPDGTERLMRLDASDQWIRRFEDTRGTVYFNDRGYFFSDTDAASDMLSFRVGLELHSFSQLGSYLFRPDMLERQLGVTERALFELTQRDVERIQRARTLAPDGVDVERLTPPSIEVEVPVDSVDQPFVEVAIRAEGFGIDEQSIVARIVGAGQARGATPSPSGDRREALELIRRVPLIPGQNDVELTVYDANGLSHTQRFTVTYSPETDHKPVLYAAVIATSEYSADTGLSALPLTQNDARAIVDALEQQSGKRFDHVEIRTWCQTDGCDRAPSREAITQGIPEFFEQANNGDYLLLYVSGHGIKRDTEYFMVPSDGHPERAESMVSWTALQDWLRAAALGKKIVFLDTCHAGAVFENQRDKHRLVQQAAEYDGIYVLSATAADASAFELSSLGNGLFTYVVREGLDGQADLGSDGRVSFEELSFHVARRVREISTVQRVRMEPYVPILDQHMDFPFVEVNKVPSLALRVSDLSSFDSTATPERRRWWEQALTSGKDPVKLTTPQAAGFSFVVVEDAGVPRRAQLATGDQRVLGQWRFEDATPDTVLADVLRLMREDQARSSGCRSRGFSPAQCPAVDL